VWLFQITANLWRDQLRRRRRHAKWQKSPRAIVVVAEIRPDVIAQERDEVARAVAAMDELPVKQRQVLYLRACEGLSIDEIAAVLEVTPGSVKSNLSLARKTMRRRFFKEHECHLSGGAQE
jgi:RNA polymerase sigma-70 factor (ECF subfamily)